MSYGLPWDLRGHLALLDERGLLARVRREVEPRFELCAVLTKLLPLGKAALFERVRGAAFPVAGNVACTRDMLALALGCARDDVPRTWRDRTRTLIPPEIVPAGPVQEVVRVGREARLSDLPICTHSEKDAGAYVTAGVALARDAASGARNLSFNRVQYRDTESGRIRSMPPQYLGKLYAQAEARNEPLPLAIVVGLHPVELCAAATSPADEVDELAIAGALRGAPVPLVRCKTIPLEVPAYAELVLEGEILPHTREPEAPFGDFMQFYMPQVESPVFRLTALTHRRDAWYHTIQAGTNDDMHLLAPSREALVLDAVERAGTRVHAVSLLPTILGCAISIHQQFAREAKNVAAVALGTYTWAKTCLVVDHDVDVYDYQELLWALATRCRPDRGTFVIAEALGFPRDPFHLHQSKLAIDATIPLGEWAEFERKRVPSADTLRLEDYLE